MDSTDTEMPIVTRTEQMTEKTFNFVSGMPRSGSTLLCNILCQNPRFHATNTSGCLDVIWNLRNHWDTLIEHKAHELPEAKTRCMRAILHAYHADREQKKPVIFDKGRGWIGYIEIIKLVLSKEPKILVPVRDLRDVLASFEKLYRGTIDNRRVPADANNYFEFQTIAGRCETWCRREQPVGLSVNRIRDAVHRGFRSCLHFVEYEMLTMNPREAMRGIYNFLGEELYEHDFDNVEQVTQENDELHGFGPTLHQIRPKVSPQPSQFPEVLGDVAEKYKQECDFWKTL